MQKSIFYKYQFLELIGLQSNNLTRHNVKMNTIFTEKDESQTCDVRSDNVYEYLKLVKTSDIQLQKYSRMIDELYPGNLLMTILDFPKKGKVSFLHGL